MYDLPEGSLVAILSNPLYDKVDMGDIHLSTLSTRIKSFKSRQKSYVAPETDALTFYFLNHVAHVIKSKYNPVEELPKDIQHLARECVKATNTVAQRLFYYSVVIALEEARFLYVNDNKRLIDYLHKSFGEDFGKWAEKGFRSGSLEDLGNMDMTCAEYTRAMTAVFSFGKWQGGFGGKGWVPISSLAQQCVRGDISIESMADQAFSLCHNNGSMFNKGHLYHYYTQFIYDILDIQDSGQIPQWISSNLGSKFVTKELRDLYDLAFKHFPDDVSGKVDTKLISGSAQKRTKKQQALKAQQQATWNNNVGKAPPDEGPKISKQDSILLPDSFKSTMGF